MLKIVFALTQLVNTHYGLNEHVDCICPRCPSYPDCAIDPDLRLFCMRTKAPCKIQRRGCMCPGCKVHSRHRYTRNFYCDVGTDDEQAATR